MQAVQGAAQYLSVLTNPSKSTKADLIPSKVSADDAAVFIKSPKISSIELERHLADYRRGEPEASQEIGARLENLFETSGLALAYHDPELARDYGAYRSALTYSREARFVNNVDEALSHQFL